MGSMKKRKRRMKTKTKRRGRISAKMGRIETWMTTAQKMMKAMLLILSPSLNLALYQMKWRGSTSCSIYHVPLLARVFQYHNSNSSLSFEFVLHPFKRDENYFQGDQVW